jgi:hypothetical protein
MTKHTQVGQRVGWRKAAATAILEPRAPVRTASLTRT